jgi:hypothetical protein
MGAHFCGEVKKPTSQSKTDRSVEFIAKRPGVCQLKNSSAYAEDQGLCLWGSIRFEERVFLNRFSDFDL